MKFPALIVNCLAIAITGMIIITLSSKCRIYEIIKLDKNLQYAFQHKTFKIHSN